MKLKDKVVVVTGGANGIGEALARRFAAEGARGVCVVDREGDTASVVADDIGGLALAADVSREDDIRAVVADTESRLGPIDVFCSNAGVGFGDGGPTAASAANEAWETSWAVNVMAHVYAARAVLPGMIERGGGYLVNTVSAAGLLNQIGDAAYSTTKHAAVGFAESLAITHGDQGIRVSVVCPQYVATRMVDQLFSEIGLVDTDGILPPAAVADAVVAGMDEERFLILPHEVVKSYMANKVGDYDRWLGGMRKLRRHLLS